MRSPGHRFYEKLNELLDSARFTKRTRRFVSPSTMPAVRRTRIDSTLRVLPNAADRVLRRHRTERGICWRCEDSLLLRESRGLNGAGRVPDHSTLSRTRFRLDREVYDAFFQFVLRIVDDEGLLKGCDSQCAWRAYAR